MLNKKIFWWAGGIIFIAGAVILITIMSTKGRTLIHFNILQNKEVIQQSDSAKVPQFAIWLENPRNHVCQTVFVTLPEGSGDWEGKAKMNKALPRWSELFMSEVNRYTEKIPKQEFPIAVTGATPVNDYFSVRAEVPPGSKWICWIEMNLEGDYNESFPQDSLTDNDVDGFHHGQPALLYKSEITAEEGTRYNFTLAGQSISENNITVIEPVSEGVSSAKDVFNKLDIMIIRPKPKIIDKNKIDKNGQN